MPQERFILQVLRHRSVSKEDIPAINALLRPLTEDRFTRRAFRKFLAKKGYWVVARDREQGGQIVGTGAFSVVSGSTRTWARFERVSVLKTFEDQGIGSRIMERLIKEAQRRKIRPLRLSCDARSPKLHAFYTKHGFERMEHVASYKRNLE